MPAADANREPRAPSSAQARSSRGAGQASAYRRITRNVAAMLAGVVAVGLFAGLFVVGISLEAAADRAARTTAEVIEGSLAMQMTNRDVSGMAAELALVTSRSSELEMVQVLNMAGEVAVSSVPGNTGTSRELHSPGCVDCHADAEAPRHLGTQSRVIEGPDGDRHLAMMHPVANRPECWNAACHAHAEEDIYLGLIELELSLREVDDDLLLLRLGGFGSVLFGLPLTVFLLFLVVRRVLSSITKRTITRLNNLTDEMSAASRQQEATAAAQSSAVEEVRRAMDGLRIAAGEIADGAGTVVAATEQSAYAAAEVADRVKELTAHAAAIGELAETIREIAAKSDNLALNASLEGIRAGEAGRGFVIVGNELRALAELVSGTVGDIHGLAVEIEKVSGAAISAGAVGEHLTTEATKSAKGITLVTQQQRTAAEQVTQSMDDAQDAAQQTVAAAHAAKQMAEELVAASRELHQLVEGDGTAH